MSRPLSALESKLILRLEWEKQPVVTIEDAMAILDVSYDQARQVLSRLARSRWLAPILPGKYELIPAERGEYAFPDTNPLFIGSVLFKPYYFSYATAAFFHGLSAQASATVYIATTRRAGMLVVRDKEFRLVRQPPQKFFGATEVDAYGSRVQMAEPEKAFLDCLDRPQYAGDIPEVAAMLWRGKGRLDWCRLSDYALRFCSQSLVQRLGYLADVLNVPVDDETRRRLLMATGKSTCYLGQPGRWGHGGEYHATWRVVDNVPRQVLLGDIEVR